MVIQPQCIGMLFSAIKTSVFYKAVFNVTPQWFILVQLKSVCFTLRSPVTITLSTEFFMLFNRAVFMIDVGGMWIIEILADFCESFKIIMMASLSVSIEDKVSEIQKLILLCTRIATPLCLLGLSLHIIIWFAILSLKLGNVNDYAMRIYSKYVELDGSNRTCITGQEEPVQYG